MAKMSSMSPSFLRRAQVALLLGSLAWASQGCLLLSEWPTYRIGEQCTDTIQCPAESHCEGICLPDAAECTVADDPRCGGFACNTAVSIAYCFRSCTGQSECIGGYRCDYASNTCVPGCTGSGQCGSGKYCDFSDGTCKPGCESSDDCPTNYICGYPVEHACGSL